MEPQAKPIFPALIIKAPYAAAMVQGLPHRSSGPAVLRKTVEIRGPRCYTDYRGPVAVFCSAAYDYAVEDHIVRWYVASTKPKTKAASVLDDGYVRAWCQYTHAWKYRLIGFVALEDVSKRASLTQHQARASHVDATDFNVQWSDEDRIYLRVSALYQYPRADGPKFSDVCTGCQAETPHNAAACHVNWQTVGLPSSVVPTIALTAQKDVKPWPRK